MKRRKASRRGVRYSPEFKQAAMDALRANPSVQGVAHAFGVAHATIGIWAKQAGVELPSPEERMTAGYAEGARRRWGSEIDARRTHARELRAAGATLKTIQEACGYRSLAAAWYAVQTEETINA